MPLPVIAPAQGPIVPMEAHAFAKGIHYQLTPDQLVQDCLRRKEGTLAEGGALVIKTGVFTGRSPEDRFIARDAHTQGHIDWNEFNKPLEQIHFQVIYHKITSYLNDLPELWIRDGYACADRGYRMNLRIVNETPSMNLFACNMFLRPAPQELETFRPDWQILTAPGLKLNPAECGTRQSNAVIISFAHRLVLVAGTGYTGEIKKAVFTILNYILPQEKDVLSMHCAANIGRRGDTALFFGLSGTGKTTLSADPSRRLIGDDEHGWAAHSVFNFEGGCYAKCINLKPEQEPEIYQAIRPGALVENVQFYPGENRINFADSTLTENTRVSYPLDYISNAVHPSVGDMPQNIFFLTCDAHAVLPPLSRLTPAQAMYQFMSGYTAKVAGTETGITEPKSTFSPCFSAPFLPLHPSHYARMLGRKIKDQGVQAWLVNTGWTGGPLGIGNRIALPYTRAMISAVLQGELDDVPFDQHPVFRITMPTHCPGVPQYMLNPRTSWANPQQYDQRARHLAELFTANFEKYRQQAGAELLAAGPLL